MISLHKLVLIILMDEKHGGIFHLYHRVLHLLMLHVLCGVQEGLWQSANIAVQLVFWWFFR